MYKILKKLEKAKKKGKEYITGKIKNATGDHDLDLHIFLEKHGYYGVYAKKRSIPTGLFSNKFWIDYKIHTITLDEYYDKKLKDNEVVVEKCEFDFSDFCSLRKKYLEAKGFKYNYTVRHKGFFLFKKAQTRIEVRRA